MNHVHKKLFPLLLIGLAATCTLGGCKKKDMSMKMNEPRNIRGVQGFQRTFNDQNPRHLAMAQAIGVPPVASQEEARGMTDRLHLIADNERYAVDSLTHSIPYLVPGAARLLDTIGANFLDSLRCKGLNPNKVLVTSVLRTQQDVKKLRRRNVNASARSAHCYGTTFDVSWKRFVKIEDPDGRPMQDVSPDTLKLVLAEVLRDLQHAKQCYVKYEIRQGCFVIGSILLGKGVANGDASFYYLRKSGGKFLGLFGDQNRFIGRLVRLYAARKRMGIKRMAQVNAIPRHNQQFPQRNLRIFQSKATCISLPNQGIVGQN